MDINVFYCVAYRSEDNDKEVKIHFHEMFEKWNLLNLTKTCWYLKGQVGKIVTSIAQWEMLCHWFVCRIFIEARCSISTMNIGVSILCDKLIIPILSILM